MAGSEDADELYITFSYIIIDHMIIYILVYHNIAYWNTVNPHTSDTQYTHPSHQMPNALDSGTLQAAKLMLRSLKTRQQTNARPKVREKLMKLPRGLENPKHLLKKVLPICREQNMICRTLICMLPCSHWFYPSVSLSQLYLLGCPCLWSVLFPL